MTDNTSAPVFSRDEPIVARAEGTGDTSSSLVLFACRSSAPGWLSERLALIDRLRQLRRNWDSYGAPPVDIRSIILARHALNKIAFIDTIEAPTVTATPSGNVALCWDDGHRSLDLEIQPDGTFSFVYFNDSEPLLDFEATTTDLLDIVEMLTRF